MACRSVWGGGVCKYQPKLNQSVCVWGGGHLRHPTQPVLPVLYLWLNWQLATGN